ncbi:MAG TPA: zf-HC2 domain-containing protein [Blastocatellia bacterium]|nr:zf-HC2 domain-containing protein [Blastocatellia bacterium]
MECKKFQIIASAYLDGQVTDAEAVASDAHLAACGDCRRHIAEVEQASSLLRELTTPETPRELHGYVMREVALRARKELTVMQRAVGWLQKFNPRLVSYSAGSMLSAVLFALVFSGFRPIPVPAVEAKETALIFPVVSGSDREYHSYNNLPQNKDAATEENYYQLPRVLDNSALISFSHIVYSKPGNEAMSAMVEVDSDGRAQLIDVLNAPKDPQVIEQLWWSLRNRTFQPATVSGRPVSTRIIMFVEKVDISG